MTIAFRYHPDAQLEWDVIFNAGGPMLRRCLGMAYIRHTRIEDGSEPLQRLTEFIGPGFRNSALFAVEYDAHMLDWVEFIYEEYGQELVVLAIDAWQLGTSFGSRVGGDARARARSRSR